MASDPAIQAAARALRSARIAQYSEAVRSAPNYDRARHEPEIAEQERIGREWSWDGDLAVAAAVVAAVRPIVIRECAEAIEAERVPRNESGYWKGYDAAICDGLEAVRGLVVEAT